MPAISFSQTIALSEKGDEWYEVAYEGKFVHPISRKEFELSQEKFDSWNQYHAYLKGHGNTIPIVKNHSTDPTDRLGSITETKKEGRGYWIKIQWNDDKTKQAVKNSSFSIMSKPDALTFDNKSFPHALMHVGVTDYPVIKGLKKALAAEEFFLEGEILTEKLFDLLPTIPGNGPDKSGGSKETPKVQQMKELATFLGLSESASETSIIAEVKKIKDALKASEIKCEEIPVLQSTIKKFNEGLVAERKKLLDGLSEDVKKKFEPYCTAACVLADFGKSDTLFELALSAVKGKKGSKNGEEDPERLEEDFATGKQSSDKDPALSESELVAAMKADAAEYEKSRK